MSAREYAGVIGATCGQFADLYSLELAHLMKPSIGALHAAMFARDRSPNRKRMGRRARR